MVSDWLSVCYRSQNWSESSLNNIMAPGVVVIVSGVNVIIRVTVLSCSYSYWIWGGQAFIPSRPSIQQKIRKHH